MYLVCGANISLCLSWGTLYGWTCLDPSQLICTDAQHLVSIPMWLLDGNGQVLLMFQIRKTVGCNINTALSCLCASVLCICLGQVYMMKSFDIITYSINLFFTKQVNPSNEKQLHSYMYNVSSEWMTHRAIANKTKTA